jgi:hypothetical protein
MKVVVLSCLEFTIDIKGNFELKTREILEFCENTPYFRKII